MLHLFISIIYIYIGTKFRIPSKFNIKNIVTQFIYDIDLFIYKISIYYNKPTAYFNQWKQLVIDSLTDALNNNISDLVTINTKHLFQQISHLQNNFVISYVDKSPNNYAIMCKSYYHQLLISTLSSNNSFKLTNSNTIINNRKINSFYKLLHFPSTNFNYPYLVLIPKFHKSPIKFRTVTIGCNTYNNKANKLLLNILNQLYSVTSKIDNVHCIKNSFMLIDILKNLKSISNIVTFDFKDLFNNINLSDLFTIINSLFIKFRPHLSLPTHVDAEYFSTLTNFIIYNNYILQDNSLYLQTIGIPQGGCSSSLLADLYLYHYEHHFKNLGIHLYRYIDDIIVINTTSSNTNFIPDFYPSNLEFITNLPINNNIQFLDLCITLANNNLLTDIYDKRKDFNFKVNTFTHFKSCLHVSVFRNILLNHLFRIKRLCSPHLIQKNINQLVFDALHHGFPKKFVYSFIHR